ncbi:type 1 glutamine amidotransferase [Microbacterium sp. p3-SID336]|uniref:type 1 glutamine amidotransferase n=1 Tax=Microbacterium sp. p3-SID336 TaxID=2916212 RepID=UPI0021A2947A|nr:type 1 glutamine amidotransferase [Microbacterium sp. p3-SID336]MCT1478556.1 type 1 glutamine amidotransferase [Microbacterium sp. p3-SID336]
MTARVLVIVNSASSGPRRLGAWLEERGIAIDAVVGAEQALPLTLDGYAGLVLLGGGLMPDDDERAPWLAAERALATEAIARDLPTLGICLGGQLLAHVAGGEVKAKTGPIERGATPIRPTVEGRADAVFSALGDEAPMIENHQDMITRLPPQAVLMASSAAIENQAFRLGTKVRGVQFHPEASAADLARWDDAALRGEGRSLPELIAAAERVDDHNTAASRRLIDAFADEVQEETAA